MNLENSYKRISFRYFLLLGVTVLFFSCGSMRNMENKQRKEVYEKWGLESSSHDNFELYKEAVSWLHVQHVDGGTSHSGTDCSFLVYSIYNTVYHKTLERNSAAMLNKNCERITKNQLREGDLVFFYTAVNSKSEVTHVGIYLKDHKFIHTSTSKGVNVSSLDEDYYRKAWICGGRVK